MSAATWTATTWKRASQAVAASHHPDAGTTTLDLEAESSELADRGRAKKWDQFREGKRSSGYLIKDDK